MSERTRGGKRERRDDENVWESVREKAIDKKQSSALARGKSRPFSWYYYPARLQIF